MPSRKRDLKQAAADASAVTAYDRVTELGSDVIASVPLFGPVIAAALRQVMPRDHAIYLASFLGEVAGRIEGVEEEKFDREYFDSSEFMADTRRIIDALRMTRNQEKRRYYVAALTNSATSDRPDLVERKRFIDLLEQLRPSHLSLLAVIARSDDELWHGTTDNYLREKLPDQDLENIRLDWTDMQQTGLLASIPGGMSSTPLSQQVWNAFPAIGRRFAKFIATSEEEQEIGPPSPSV